MSRMLEAAGVVPRRFRRRLTTAFIVVGATVAAIVAVSGFIFIRAYREAVFERTVHRQAQLALLAAPVDLSLGSFQTLLEEYSQRAGFETVAMVDHLVYSSSPALDRQNVPEGLAVTGAPLRQGDGTVDGVPYRVVVAAKGSTELYFFFPRGELLESLQRTAELLAVACLGAVLFAALSGYFVARYTLRPVRQAAGAAHLLAQRLLGTQHDLPRSDELGTWGVAFDRLAEALEAKIEALRRAAERERRFTADVAHDLRTPLTALVAAAGVLEDELDTLSPPARRPARLVIDSARRLEHLVAELLELARLEANQAHTDPQVLRLVPTLAAQLAADADDPPVELVVEGDPYVLVDPPRFRRVLDNLLANAQRHGAPPVMVRARREESLVVIEVVDHGPGISPEHLERIFDRFYKPDGARSGGGSGLGLAIARENARIQGGSLEAGNSPLGGARFTLRIPAAEAAGSEHDSLRPPARDLPPSVEALDGPDRVDASEVSDNQSLSQGSPTTTGFSAGRRRASDLPPEAASSRSLTARPEVVPPE